VRCVNDWVSPPDFDDRHSERFYDTDPEVFPCGAFLSFNRITISEETPLARILITAGPTYEPIDAVRFVGNRSSGKLGARLAERALALGWAVKLLLGPNAEQPVGAGIEIIRFESSYDLETLLQKHLTQCDCLVMAAAVADYRPEPCEVDRGGKRRRTGEDLVLKLEPTPDLLAGCAKNARSDQLLVGFALEPVDELESSARRKLATKKIDLIVANPLETMNSETIDARLIGNVDRGIQIDKHTDGPIDKNAFATWLLEHLDQLLKKKYSSSDPASPTAPNTESSSHA
jgi:phosphopantothenoylcysteine decarboxylase/phosphopantothenate--cysteine ligase